MKESEIRHEFSQISREMQQMDKGAREEERGLNEDEQRRWDEMADRRKVLEGMLERKKELVRSLADEEEEEGEWRGETYAENRRKRREEGRAADDFPQSKREAGIERDESLDFNMQFRNFLASGRDGSSIDLIFPNSSGDRGGDSNYKDQLRYAQKLAEDGDEVSRRFLNLVDRTESRAQMVGSDVLGGYTVPDSDMGLFDVAMKRYNSVMQAGPRMFNTSHGRDIPIVLSDDTDEEGEWLAERQSSSEGAIEYERGELRAHSIGSKRIPISFELLRDSSFDILAHTIDQSYTRIARGKARAMTAGDGVGKPRGIIHDAVAKAPTIANTANTSYTYDNWVDFFGNLPAAYATSPTLMVSRRSRFDMMKIKDSDGRPLWMPNLVPGAPGTVLGDMYVENDFLGNLGSASQTLAVYGDIMKYYAREVQMVEVLRYSDSYLSTRSIAVEVISFCDGRLVDSGQEPVIKMVTAA